MRVNWFTLLDKKAIARFWRKVDMSGGPDACWPWVKSCVPSGYGQFMIVPGRVMRSHRIAWALDRGRSPGKRVVRHRCDNPPCCNPKHLLAGTQAQNARDAVARGRATGGSTPRPGEENPNHKLTQEQVDEIRRLRMDGITGRSVAEAFGISPAQVSRIHTQKRWAVSPVRRR